MTTKDRRVHEIDRTAYLDAYLTALAGAMASGVPVLGLVRLVLLDNVERAEGYAKRIGLVYVDYPTLERVPKASFYWYPDLTAAPAPTRTSAAWSPLADPTTGFEPDAALNYRCARPAWGDRPENVWAKNSNRRRMRISAIRAVSLWLTVTR